MVDNWSRCSGSDLRLNTCVHKSLQKRQARAPWWGVGGCSVRAGNKRTKGPMGNLGSRITPKRMLPGWCSGINGSPKSYL